VSARILVPDDTGARSVGADAVAARIEREVDRLGLDARVIRNGSRGLYWLEPLVEVESTAGRLGFAGVSAVDVPSLFADGRLPTSAHPACLGVVEHLPALARQRRLTFRRAGVIEPTDPGQYRAHGGGAGLARARLLTPQQIVDEITASGLRGRGGAAFPAGRKWQTVLDRPDVEKYVVCNADEGDSGTFADRLLMEADPLQLVEGMTIAARAVGASRGFVYLRSEYPLAARVFARALDVARTAGILGRDARGAGLPFDIELRIGAGAYVCGEETALLESLEGKRGVVRAKPPLPAIEGLFGRPTLVNNVLTLAAATDIVADGGARYAAFGFGRSRGTMPFQLAGNIRQGGLFELEFGVTLRALIEDFGGGSASDRALHAAQVGGPLGAYLPPAAWDIPLDYEAFTAAEAMLGHGGVVVFDDRVDMGAQAQFAMEFCAHESCGKCTPCRIGSTRGAELIAGLRRGEDRESGLVLLEELCETMELGSLCALGGMAPMPVRSVLRHFNEELMGRSRRTH